VDMREALALLATLSLCAAAPLFAPLDGKGNRLEDSAGSLGSRFARRFGVQAFADARSSIDPSLPNAREVSNVLFATAPFRYNT
jgi:hypothetical protein